MRSFVWLLATVAYCASPTRPGLTLPGDAFPYWYQVNLQIDPASEVFQGEVTIDVGFKHPTSVIYLNAKDLQVQSARLAFTDASFPVPVRVVNKEMIAISLPLEEQSDLRVILRYRGRLDDKAVVGAYRRKVDGNWYVYTTFTPIEARRAIPCFDEPRFKPRWQINLLIPGDQRAFSNAAEMSEQTEPDGQKWVHFAQTEWIPSELVAFAVGPFDVYQGRPAGHGTPIRAITPKGESAEGKAAADTTVAILPRLEEYTGIPYAFGKLDHLALADAAFGAVENPGLITYLAREMLMVPGSETISRTRALHLLEAHELGHQWFGDLVTQASWADVWLSEGFATWIAQKVMDQEDRPERAHLGLMEARERIMEADSSRRSRPVRLEPHNRDGTRDIYNRFVYDKGASVLMMLEDWLGEDKFRDGIRGYLKDHSFGNASTADLAAELKKAAGADPSAVMHSFLDETGVPRVTAEIECVGVKRIKLRQTGASAVPVCYRGAGVDRACTVLNGPAEEIDLPKGSTCPAWIEANAGGTGYYRTGWTQAQLTALPLQDLTPAERLTLAFDLRALPADRMVTREVLTRLASDPQPEVARAAQDTLEPPIARGTVR